MSSHGGSLGVLQGVTNLLFTDCIGDRRSLAEEIEVLADSSSARPSAAAAAAAESVVVEGILIGIKLVAQTIVSILKIDARIEVSSSDLILSTMMDNGSSRVVILKGPGTGNLREGIGVLEETPSSGGTTLAVPRQGGIKAKERHASLDDGKEVGIGDGSIWWGRGGRGSREVHSGGA